MTKKAFVAEVAKVDLEQRREEVRRRMIDSMNLLDGSLTSTVAMLTGLSSERICLHDISVVLLPVEQALDGIGAIITSIETVGALMAARTQLP
jgi:hypothetical protein